jgi:hypothetical protein
MTQTPALVGNANVVNPVSLLQLNSIRNFDVQKVVDQQLLANVLRNKPEVLDTYASVAFNNSALFSGNVLAQLFAFKTLTVKSFAYDWKLETVDQKRVSIINTPDPLPQQVGRGRRPFRLTLDRNAFGANRIIRFQDDETTAFTLYDPTPEPDGSGWTYTFVINSDDAQAYVDRSMLESGKFIAVGWSEYSEVSNRGDGVDFGSGIMLRNWLSISRKTLGFTRSAHYSSGWSSMPLIDPTTGQKMMDVVGPDIQWKMFFEMKKDEERQGWDSEPKSGTLIDPKTNKPVYSGAGIKQQISPSNNFERSGRLSYKYLERICEQITPLRDGASGKIRVVLGTGRAGMRDFDEMVSQRAKDRGAQVWLQNILASNSDPSAMVLSGFYKGVEVLNGDVEVYVKHVPLFDDLAWNMQRDSQGDLFGARDMVLFNIGEGKDSIPNVSRVVYSGGDAEGRLGWYVPGSVDPYSASGGLQRSSASGADGYEMHTLIHSSYRLGDPTGAAWIRVSR